MSVSGQRECVWRVFSASRASVLWRVFSASFRRLFFRPNGPIALLAPGSEDAKSKELSTGRSEFVLLWCEFIPFSSLFAEADIAK